MPIISRMEGHAVTHPVLARLPDNIVGYLWASFTAAAIVTGLRMIADVSAGAMGIADVPLAFVWLGSIQLVAFLRDGFFGFLLLIIALELIRLRFAAFTLLFAMAGAALIGAEIALKSGPVPTAPVTNPEILYHVIGWALGGLVHWWISLRAKPVQTG